jgi:Flp pilus assembly protein TadG
MMRSKLQPRLHSIAPRHRQGGAVLVLVAIAMIALIGFVGLALDLGKLYVTKSELQNSADACALAASRDLDGITPLSVSEAAGIGAGHINLALFQTAPVSMTVDNNVQYATSYSGPFQDKQGVTTATLPQYKYVQCTTSVTGISTWLVQVLNLLPGVNLGPSSVSARAVATIGHAQSTCAIPVFICDPSPSTYTPGQWLVGKTGTSSGPYTQGMFGWGNLSAGSTNPCNGANCLSQQLTGSTCNIPAVGQQIGQNGNIASLWKSYNTRFGIQYNGSGQPIGQSDFTGYAYTTTNWGTGFDAYDGAAIGGVPNYKSNRDQRSAYQGDNALSTPGNNFNTGGNPGSDAVYQAGGDRRLTFAPMVDCNTMNSSAGATVTNWACVLMLDPMQQGGSNNTVHLEYRGLATDPGIPCATLGVPGSSGNGPLVPALIQ